MDEAIKAIVDALMSGDSAPVLVGALAMPVTALLREIVTKWKKLGKYLNGWRMLLAVTAVSTGLCYIWSQLPGSSMEFAWGPVLSAAASAVFLRQGLKHTGTAKP